MILLISYDLNGHERPSAYSDVKKVIEDNALEYKTAMYSQWLVETDDTMDTWNDALRAVMDDDDRLFVLQVRRPYKGWLSKSIWHWLSENL